MRRFQDQSQPTSTRRKYNVEDRHTGKKFTIDWNGPNDPTEEDVDRLIRRQKIQSAPKKESLWTRLSTPLMDIPEWGKSEGFFGDIQRKIGGEDSYAAKTANFINPMLEQMTAPLDMGVTAASLGSSTIPRLAFRGLSALTAARGGENIYRGIEEGDPGKIGAGALEGGLSLFGMRGPRSTAALPELVDEIPQGTRQLPGRGSQLALPSSSGTSQLPSSRGKFIGLDDNIELHDPWKTHESTTLNRVVDEGTRRGTSIRPDGTFPAKDGPVYSGPQTSRSQLPDLTADDIPFGSTSKEDVLRGALGRLDEAKPKPVSNTSSIVSDANRPYKALDDKTLEILVKTHKNKIAAEEIAFRKGSGRSPLDLRGERGSTKLFNFGLERKWQKADGYVDGAEIHKAGDRVDVFYKNPKTGSGFGLGKVINKDGKFIAKGEDAEIGEFDNLDDAIRAVYNRSGIKTKNPNGPLNLKGESGSTKLFNFGRKKKEDFIAIGDKQRGFPESAMLRAQEKMGGGVINPAIEHVGDLTHRMNDSNTWNSAGYEFVKDKVEKSIRWLTNPYGFSREFGENLNNNANYYGKNVKEYSDEVRTALREYSNEHRKLPIYNRAHKFARDAAIALGEERFDDALKNLRSLQSHLKTKEDWVNFARVGVDKPRSGLSKFLSDESGAVGKVRYENVKLANGKTVRLRVISENDNFVRGIEINKEGDEIIPKGKTKQGESYTERMHIIQKSEIKNRQELKYNNTYGWLEPIIKDESGAVRTNILSGPLKSVGQAVGKAGAKIGKPIAEAGTKIRDKVNLNMINNPSKTVQAIKEPYQKWVNERAARKGYAFNVRQDFKDLESSGMAGIFAYNKGQRGGRYDDVEKWFNDNRARIEASGVKIGFKENYLPQIWANSKDEIKKVFGNKRLTLKPSVAFKSIVDTYEEGMKHGLTPKYKSIPELMGFYAETANKTIADREFFGNLRAQKLIKPLGSKKTEGWKPLDSEVFPAIRNKGKVANLWAAPPEVQAIIQNYLKERNPTVKAILGGIQFTKDVALASGLPGTAFNAHGFNMLVRSTAMNKFEGFTRALKYMSKSGSDATMMSRALNKVLPWNSANDTIMKNRHIIPEIQRYGGRLGVEGHDFDEQIAKGAKSLLGRGSEKLVTKHRDMFETHLFDKMVPALKIDYYNSTVPDLVKSGIPLEQAKKEAARAMNLAFAGVNYDELATNKNILDLSRALLLAPDWYASNVGLVKNMGQSILDSKHPGAKLYKDAAKGLLGIYTAANVMNAVTTGISEGKPKFMWQNESGRTFDIDTGTYTISEDGTKKKVYLSPFGTAFDLAKIPLELAVNAFKGDITAFRTLKNRLSLPAHSGVNLLGNTNDFGQRLYGDDVYGNDIPLGKEILNIGEQMVNPVTPAYVKGIKGGLTGEMEPLEAVAQSIEAPLRFRRQDRPRGGRGRPRRPSRRR